MTILLSEMRIGVGARGAEGSDAHMNERGTDQSEFPVASNHRSETIINFPFEKEQAIVSVVAMV